MCPACTPPGPRKMSARARGRFKKTATPMAAKPKTSPRKPAKKTARAPKARATGERAKLLERLKTWQALVVEMRGLGARREMIEAQRHADAAEDALLAFDLAAVIDACEDPEVRARQLVRAALRRDSHVAARGNEEAHQALRQARLTREEEAERRRRDRMTPTDAMSALIGVLLELGPAELAYVYDRLGDVIYKAPEPAATTPGAH